MFSRSDMRAVMIVKDPEAFQLLADDTRRRMIHLLRAKERTVAQIAEELGLTPQAIYHHVRKMKEAGLVEVAREERVDHFIETYYRAAAEVFHMSHGEGGFTKIEEQSVLEALQNLSKIGIEARSDPATAAKILALQSRMKALGCSHECEEKIINLEDVDFFGKQALLEYAGYLSMNDDDFDEYLKLYKQIRDLLKPRVTTSEKKRKSR